MAVIEGTLRDDGGAVYNVRNSTFGGSASTVDWAPVFQAAINTAAAWGGGTVYVPAGNYRHSFFTVHGNVNLVGTPGTVLECMAVRYPVPSNNQNPGVPIAIAAGIVAPAGVDGPFAASRWGGIIEGIHFTTASGFGFAAGTIFLNIFNAQNYGVVRCKITGIRNASAIKHNTDAMWYAGSSPVRSNGRFLYNYIDGGADSSEPDQEGISIQRIYLDQNTDLRATNMQVVGNTIVNTADDPIAGHGVSGFWVRDNYCRTLDGHITANDCTDFHILANDCAHTATQGGTGLIWVGATFDNAAVGSKRGEIRFNQLQIPAGPVGSQPEPNPIFLFGVTDVEVTHNHITNLSSHPARIYVGPNNRKIGTSDGGRPHLPYGRVLVDDNVLHNTGIFFDEPAGEPVRTGWIRARRNTITFDPAESSTPNAAGTDADSRHIRAPISRFPDDDVDPRGWNSINHLIHGSVVAQPELLCEWYAKDIANVATVQMLRFDSLLAWYAPADVLVTSATVESDQDLPATGPDVRIRVNTTVVEQFPFSAAQLPRLFTYHLPTSRRVPRGSAIDVQLGTDSRLTGRDIVVRVYGVRLNRMAT